MNANLRNESEFSNLPSLNQSYSTQIAFEEEMAYMLNKVVPIIEKAHEMTLQELSMKSLIYQNRNSKPNRMNENIIGLFYEQFPDEMRENINRRHYFERKGLYRVFFKKFDKRLRPMNIQTQATNDILYKDAGYMKVFIGYTLNRTGDEIKDICAVYRPKNQIVWVTDLRNFSNGLRSLDIFSPSPIDDDPIIVKPKHTKPNPNISNNSEIANQVKD